MPKALSSAPKALDMQEEPSLSDQSVTADRPAESAARLASDHRERGIVAQQVLGFGGAPGTNRTCDLSLRRGSLYPLSYGGAALAILPERAS